MRERTWAIVSSGDWLLACLRTRLLSCGLRRVRFPKQQIAIQERHRRSLWPDEHEQLSCCSPPDRMPSINAATASQPWQKHY